MKKIVAIILSAIMLLALVSCGNSNNGDDTTTPADTTTAAPGGDVTTPADSTTAAPGGEETTGEEASNDVVPTVDENTLGGKLWADFVKACKENPSATTEELANVVSSNPALQFMKMVAEIEPGYLGGFDNTEIKGFKSGFTFGPMVGSIPFVGYIFQLEEGSDVAAFVKNLTDSANPSWNVCVEADQTVAGSCGNYVFFVMCPADVN